MYLLILFVGEGIGISGASSDDKDMVSEYTVTIIGRL